MRFELELHPRSDSDRYDLDIQVSSRRNEGSVPFVVIQIPQLRRLLEMRSPLVDDPLSASRYCLDPSGVGRKQDDTQWILSLDISDQDLAELMPTQTRFES